ncbi:MAG: TetR/AcrR family transcriptional regulator [Slackia sp.]|nr:TetR/AcrR family transcriptional regulator [Slackia sp.]
MITDLCKGGSFFDSPDVKMKMRILHAIDGSLDRITISEICQNAGISRQTFYRHFKSKYDIPSWHTIFCRQFYLNEIGRSINWETGYYHHLRLITEERDFYRKSIQYTINEPFGQTVIPENRKSVILETLTNYKHVRIDRNMRFIVETFTKLECEILNDWMRSDKETDLAEWTDDLLSIVPDRLYRAMQIGPLRERDAR